MGAVTQTAPAQFEVRFEALGGLVQRVLGGAPPAVDPYLLARAITEVMRCCQMRSAAGRRLLWNEYRVILAGADFSQVRALEAVLQRDLRAVLSEEAGRLQAELVGELCVHVVADESSELPPGRAVVRVGFVPTAELAAPGRGEMTVRLQAVAGGVIHGAPAAGNEHTVPVGESVQVDPSLGVPYHLEWPGGAVALRLGARVVAGRPHPGHPAEFVPLTGAPTTINKQHIWLIAMSSRVVVGRMPGANPVHLDGASLGAGQERELAKPEIEIRLSRGDLVLRLRRSGR